MKKEEARSDLLAMLEKYPKALNVFRKVEEREDVQALLELANNLAINRLGFNDHGPTHAYIVARHAVNILEILRERGLEPNIVREGIGSMEDAAAVVSVAGFLHDIGNAVHREHHEKHSVTLAIPVLREVLKGVDNAYTIYTHVLEAINAHESEPALSVEASIVKIADGMDMEEGRARIPYKLGKFDIHAVSALSIQRVRAEPGEKYPLRIVVDMEHTAGLFQVEKVLGTKIRTSVLSGKVEVLMRIKSLGEKKLVF